MRGRSVHISELRRQHSQQPPVAADQRRALRSSVACRARNGAQRGERLVRLDILDDDTPAPAQRAATSRIILCRNLFEEVEEGLLESLMSGDQQNLAARIKQLNCAFVCPQQLDGRTEHLFQPGMKLPFAPKSCACLTELFQRGCVACKLRFDRLQISKVSAAPRFALPERLPGIR